MTDSSPSIVKHVIELDQRGLRIDGVFRPLVSGSFEYWRHHSLYWRKIIRLMRESGLEFIATFVCWDFHELKVGEIDFTGRTHPSRDLAGFIDLCAEEGLGVMIRVGPNIDAEWPTRGPAPDVTPLERLRPEYLRRTREYIKALEPILVPRLATRGGPIVLVSIDNEAYFPYSTDVESDPSAGSMHVPYDADFVMKRYHGWLKQCYGSSAKLASSWSQPGITFTQVTEPDYRRAGLKETLDSFDFITDTMRNSFDELKAMCNEIGIDVPIYTNMKQFTYYIDWRVIEQVVNSHGINLHMPNAWPGDQKLVVSWYIRLLRAINKFPWAPEFQGATGIGLDHIFGVLDENQGRFTTMLSMALGLRGLCYYVFVERDDSHFAPISPIGKTRPQLAGFREAINVLKQLRTDRHFAEVGLLWSIDHHRCQVASRFPNWRNLYDIWIDMDKPKELEPWWESFRSLQSNDVDFNLVPIDQDFNDYKTLIYAGPDFCRRAELENLKTWMDKGGKLIVTTSIPFRSTSSQEGEFTEIAKAINNSPNLIIRPWGQLSDVLKQAGVQSAIVAGNIGFWTFAYREEDAWTLFIANVGQEPALASVLLGPAVIKQINGKTVTDLLSGRKWKITHKGLWDEVPTMTPNEVRCLRIPMKEI